LVRDNENSIQHRTQRVRGNLDTRRKDVREGWEAIHSSMQWKPL